MELSMVTELFDFKYTESDAQIASLLESHCHFRFEIIAVISGCIDILIEGETYRCEKGEMAIIPPLTYHSVTVCKASKYRRITALFDGNSLADAIVQRLTANVKGSPIFSFDALQFMIESLHNAITKDDIKTYSPLAQAIAMQIIYVCAEEDVRNHRQDEENDGNLLQTAIKYVDQHIKDKISLEDMAQALFISRSSLCHIFSERMQISPKQYIIQKKMAYATMLIENGTPMTQAARAIGYDNYSNFYRMYKKTNSRGV